MKILPRLLPLLAFLALPISEAAAQAGSPGMIRPNQQARPQAGPAPALPGLATRTAPAPIDADPSANLAPNEALFDAVNRGDLAAAREAVSRGANLQARNALGLTALDAAVDQGRNEIAFFLLSAREAGRPLPADGPTALVRPSAAAPVSRPQPRRELSAPPTAQAPRTARLWAGDGGAPRPEIGFLGFDAGRPVGSQPPSGGRGGRG
jgi:hypothetical protein